MIGRKALVVRAIAGSCERTVCRFYSNITDFLTGGVWAGGGVCGGGCGTTSIALFEVCGGDAGIAYSNYL